jgi:hypothetical protein
MASLTDAALAAEIRTDPAGLGYAPLVDDLNDGGIADLLNDPTRGGVLVGPVPWSKVAIWGARNKVRSKIQAAANDPAHPANDVALTFMDFVRGLSQTMLDLSDPVIVGANADGSPCGPADGPAAYPGMLDALVASGVLVGEDRKPLKNDLIGLGVVPVARAKALWTDAPTITGTHVSRALRGQS